MLDTLIRGAQVVDGTGRAAFPADVGILDGMIEEVGDLQGAQAFETIEANGRVLTPALSISTATRTRQCSARILADRSFRRGSQRL